MRFSHSRRTTDLLCAQLEEVARFDGSFLCNSEEVAFLSVAKPDDYPTFSMVQAPPSALGSWRDTKLPKVLKVGGLQMKVVDGSVLAFSLAALEVARLMILGHNPYGFVTPHFVFFAGGDHNFGWLEIWFHRKSSSKEWDVLHFEEKDGGPTLVYNFCQMADMACEAAASEAYRRFGDTRAGLLSRLANSRSLKEAKWHSRK